MTRKIRVLGLWEGPPRGDFPVEALMSRLKELPDVEYFRVQGVRILAVLLADDENRYGLGVFYASDNNSWMMLLQGREDWEALKHVAEEYGLKYKSSIGESLNRTLVFLKEHTKSTPSDVDLDEFIE